MTVLSNLGYCGLDLDRCGVQLGQHAFLDTEFSEPDSLFVPLFQDANLIRINENNGEPIAVFLSQEDISQVSYRSSSVVFLGKRDGRAFFAVELCSFKQIQGMLDKIQVFDLRKVGPELPAMDAALLAYARGMLFWLREHPYCCRCGSKNKIVNGGHLQVCPQCQYETYPRLNPAVIVLVESQMKSSGDPVCLLGRHKGSPESAYSTLAGFVEIGESLEVAVEREVFEEVGIKITEVNYLGSQPWPFPSSLMIGFLAKANYDEVRVDKNELQDARWFTRDQIRSFGEWGDSRASFTLSRPDSIARTLVKYWLEN